MSSWLFPIHLNTYVRGYDHYKNLTLFHCGDILWTSEFDVYRRQIFTTKDDPRAVRLKNEMCLKHQDLQMLGPKLNNYE